MGEKNSAWKVPFRHAFSLGRSARMNYLNLLFRAAMLRNHGRIELRGRMPVFEGGIPFMYFQSGGRMILGDGVRFISQCGRVMLNVGARGRLVIGDDTLVNWGTEIGAYSEVAIGKHVLIAPQCVIADNPFHPTEEFPKHPAKARPIVIEDHAWIGHGAQVSPGVTIGHHSIVARLSVVYEDVPPMCIVRGNPAVFYRDLNIKDRDWKRGGIFE